MPPYKCFIANILLLKCCAMMLVSCHKKQQEPLVLSVIYKSIDSIQAIEPINDSLVKPLVYTNVISLRKLSVKKKKQKFIDMILPSVLVAKQQIERNRREVMAIRKKLADSIALSGQEQVFLRMVMEKYNAPHIDSLNTKMITHPTSIVLGQAAIESGWGTSRFFSEGCNIFGIWSFNKTEPRIKSSRNRPNGKKVYVKKYSNLSASIEDYFRIIGKLDAYKKFRYKRKNTDDAYKLIPDLHRYSELGKTYTKKLENIIRQNNLTRYDSYHLDSAYFVKENWWFSFKE